MKTSLNDKSAARVLIIGAGSLIGKAVCAKLIRKGVLVESIGQSEAEEKPELVVSKAAAAQVVVLCTHGHVSEGFVQLLKDHACVIDSSPKFRHQPDWHYGFFGFEGNRLKPKDGPVRVATAGCLAQAVTLVLRPVLAQDAFSEGLYVPAPLYQVNALLPASAGGIKMLEDFTKDPRVEVFSKNHRHAQEVALNLRVPEEQVHIQSAITSHDHGILVSHTALLKDAQMRDAAIEQYRLSLKAHKGLNVSWVEIPARNLTQELGSDKEGFVCGAVAQPSHPRQITYFCAMDNVLQGAVSNLYEAVRQTQAQLN